MIRSLIFKTFFYLGTCIICIIFLPALVLPKQITLLGGKLLGYWIKICLFIFLSVRIEVRGLENIPNNEKFFIACLHQSLFETFFLQTIFKSPVFILKKELLKIPIFGWQLKKIGSISIDRNKITKNNLGFFQKIVDHVKISNHPVIIFPQATRKEITNRDSFKKGVSKIYDKLSISCLPIALNSGKIWPRKGIIKNNDKIIITILNKIERGKNPDIFLEELQRKLFEELEKII